METTQTYTSTTAVTSRPTSWPKLGTRRLALLTLAVLLVSAFLLSIATGSVNIPIGDVLKVLTGTEPAKATWTVIIQDFRLPKALAAVLAGAALAVSGLQMQTLFRNPLAGPYVLGVSSGASLGVAIVILVIGTTGSVMLAGVGLFGDFGLAFAACLGSALVMGVVLLAARRVESSVTLLILGLMFGYAVSSVVSLLLHFSLAERIQAYVNWTFGSFGGVTWNQMKVFAPAVIAGLLLAWLLAKPLNALLLGDAYATSMGLNVRRARVWVVLSTALLAGTVTAFCGPIGFLGIAVPHLSRGLLNTSDHRVLIPAVGLLGAATALIVDLIAQVPGSQIVLPLNAVMALVGAPVVIWVILRQRSVRTSFAS
ncbi:MAG: iron ABC transporter permease [Anaerolineaceae bacterium]|nr:iron ABC transporter permease [Anaerolineaceae bacterium]